MNRGAKSARKNVMHARFLLKGNFSRAPTLKKSYKVKQKVDCQNSYIIYLGTCQKCGGQYVGKSTKPFTRQHSANKQEIKNKIGRLGQHYGGVGHVIKIKNEF